MFELDADAYQYAFVTSTTRSYLWFLSRTPTVSRELRDRFVKRAAELGFSTDKLIFVEQNERVSMVKQKCTSYGN